MSYIFSSFEDSGASNFGYAMWIRNYYISSSEHKECMAYIPADYSKGTGSGLCGFVCILFSSDSAPVACIIAPPLCFPTTRLLMHTCSQLLSSDCNHGNLIRSCDQIYPWNPLGCVPCGCVGAHSLVVLFFYVADTQFLKINLRQSYLWNSLLHSSLGSPCFCLLARGPGRGRGHFNYSTSSNATSRHVESWLRYPPAH